MDLPRSWRRPAVVLAAATAWPLLAGYLLTAGVLLAMTAAAGDRLDATGTLRTAAAVWPAVHQVPLQLGPTGAPLGVLPLLPTLALVSMIAFATGRAVRRLGWTSPAVSPAVLWWPVVAVSAVDGLAGGLVAVSRPVAGVAVPVPLAVAGCAATAAVGAAAGVLLAVGLGRVLGPVTPPWVATGVRAGAAGAVLLLAAGAAVTTLALAFSASTVHDLLAGSPGGELGLSLLSVGYLPNAMVAGLAWLAGPGFSVGAVSVGPFGSTAGPVPAVPLLAALPEPGDTSWRAMVLAVPPVVGLLVGWFVRTRLPAAGRTARRHGVVLAGAVAAATCFVLAAVAGGRLGGGAFDPVRVPPASLAIAVFGWIVLPATVFVVLADRGSAAEPPAEPPVGPAPVPAAAAPAPAVPAAVPAAAAPADAG